MDWVRLGENRVAILAGPVKQVYKQYNCTGAEASTSARRTQRG